MRCLVIVNPNSGRRIIQRNLERILGKLAYEQDCSTIKVVRTTGAGDAWKAAAAATQEQYDLILGCGGDGTLNEIVNGLMTGGSGLPLAMLPAGTVNDFGHHLKLPTEPQAFCDMIAAQSIRQVDLGRANGHFFVNVAAFGMFTDVAYKTKSRDKSILGKLAYYLQGVRDVPEQLFSTMQLEIECEGELSQHEALVCIIANSTSVGGARNVISKARVDDGKLDLLMVTKPEPLTLDGIFESIAAGEFIKIGAVHHKQLTQVRFSVLDDQQINLDLDGEYRGSLPLTVEVVPHALNLYVPPESPALARQEKALIAETRQDFIDI